MMQKIKIINPGQSLLKYKVKSGMEGYIVGRCESMSVIKFFEPIDGFGWPQAREGNDCLLVLPEHYVLVKS